MVVADGMGGHVAGEEASRLAITTLLNLVLTTPDWIFCAENPAHAEEMMRRAAERFSTVNRTLVAEAADNPRLHGFGTTLTLAASVGRNLILAHIGDSRVYLFRGGELYQLTRDHTVARAMCDAGVITPAQAATHRLRHMLTKSLGADEGEPPDVQKFTLDAGDCVLLCSDGLNDMVSDDQIAADLAPDAPSQAKCEKLIDRALAAGGKDNVTVIVGQSRVTDATSG
jgi:protein phosphatase